MPHNFKKLISLFISFCLILEQTAFAQNIDLSHYFANSGKPIIQSDKFRPLHLRYLGYDNLSQDFKILLDRGDIKKEELENKAYIEENTQTLLKYFFIGLTLPNSSFWVNLRPDAPDNIIDDDLAQTDVGKILLEADLQLKKDTAQFTSPETREGKEYWDKLYQKVEELYGTSSNITIPTLTRPWIVPDEVILRESQDNGSTALTTSAYVYKATLKVMLEQDYLEDSPQYNFSRGAGSRNRINDMAGKDPRLKELNEYSTQLIKETIIPKLIKEINTSKRYANLRQVYYSLILAQWFKQKFQGKQGIYSQLIDKRDLTDIISRTSWSKLSYFQQYQKSFQQGEYNLKATLPATTYGQTIRSYMSGGLNLMVGIPLTTQVPGDTPVAGSPVVVIPAQRELPPMGSNTIGPFKVNGWPAKAYEVDLKMVSSAVNSLEIKENKQEAVVNSSIEEIKLTDKEKRRLLSEYGKIEKFISAFSEGESRYKDIVRELVSYIFKNKKNDFWSWSKKFRELEYLHKRIIKDISSYRRSQDKESVTYKVLSNYEKEVSSIHQHLTEIIIVYGDYRYYREKVPYLKEGHLKAEEVWQKWISNSSNQDIAQKEIIELRADKVSIKDKDEKAKKIARFKENLKSWSEQGIEESREKLSNLFEKLLYREIFARGEISEEKRRILKKVISNNFNDHNYSTIMVGRASEDILKKLLSEGTLYDDAIGNLYNKLKVMEEARLIIVQEIGKEIKPISVKEAVKRIFYIAGTSLIPIGLSIMFWFQQAQDLPKQNIETPGIQANIEGASGMSNVPISPEKENEINKELSPGEMNSAEELAIIEEIMTFTDKFSIVNGNNDEKTQKIQVKIQEIKQSVEGNESRLREIKQRIKQIQEANVENIKPLKKIADKKEAVEQEEPPSDIEKADAWYVPEVKYADTQKTPQGTPVVDKEYLKPPQKVLRRNKVVSGGNISSKEWIAQYKGQPQFLGERRYAKIDPLKGTFYPDKQTSEGSKKYSSSQQSKWVIMDVPSDNQKGIVALVPPGYLIASVNTQNKVEKVDVYYDNSNGIWYLGYDKYPGKLKIEVKPMAEDDFYPVNIVDEKENALIQKEVWDLLQGKIPPEILEILQKANEDSVSLGEKQEAVRKIMGLFNHSVNPLLDELREKSDFLTNAFTYYALHCQGAAMLNAVLSNALGIPLEVWEGYRVSSEDGNLYTPGHAYNRGENGGIEDAVQQLDENSLLYALKGVLPEDWGKELKYLQQRADGIREKFSAQNQEKAIKARNQELEQKMAEMEKALQKQGEDYDGQEEVYKEKIEKLKKLRLDYASWEKLVAWAGAIDFSESKSSKELFAKRGYVLEVLTLAAYNEPSLFRKIQSVEESLYSNFILFLQDNKNFIPDTEIDLTEKDGMPYVGFAYLGEKKVVFDFLTGKKILELKIPATPEQYRLDTYVQGHIPRSAYPYNGILPDGDWLAYNPIGEAEGSWIDKNKVLFKNVKHVKEAFSSPKGEVILEVEFNNGSYGIIGPWAEKYGLSGEEYKTAPPKIHFLSDSSGRWHMWDENKKRNIGPAIEDKEELKNPRLPIIDIKLVGGKDWIAEIEIRKYYAPASTTRVFYDDQDKAIGVESSRETSERIEKEKGIVYYISPLFKKNNIDAVEGHFDIIKSLSDGDLLLMPDAGGDIFLGNIARQNNIESIKIPGYKTPYVTADGKVIIEVSYLNEAYDGQEGEAEFQFVGLGAEELGLNGKKLSFHDNNKKILRVAGTNEIFLNDFYLWEQSPAAYKLANELVRGLYWEERVVKSVNLSAGNQLLVIYKEKDGKYAMAGDWAINMGLSGLRFEKLYINSEREEISGEYPKGDGSSIEFNIPIQDLGHKDMSAMQKGIEKLGFLDWLVSEAAKELFWMLPDDKKEERRLDQRWRNFNALVSGNEQQQGGAAEEFKSIIHYMKTNKDDLPFFNCEETVKFINNNREIVVQGVNALALDELEYFVYLLKTLKLNNMSIGIIDHLDESRIKELSKGFSSPEYLWDEIIDDYIYVLSNEHDIDANKTLYVDPFSRAPAGREVVERFNRLLIEYLPPSEAKYVAGMQRIHEKMAMGGIILRKLVLPFDFHVLDMITLIKNKAGITNFSFDIEFRPFIRESGIYKMLTALRKSPEIFKLNAELFSKDLLKLNSDDYLEQARKWKEINPQLTEIFQDSFSGNKTLDTLWIEVRKDIGRDAVAMAFIIGIISFGMSFLSDFIRKKEIKGLYLGKTAGDTVSEIEENNSLFDWEDLGMRDFIEELIKDGDLLTEDRIKNQIDDFRKVFNNEERLAFDIVRSIPWEYPEKAKISLSKHLLHLVPFLSAVLLLKEPTAFKERQNMKEELKELVKGIPEGVEDIYNRFMEIMKRYSISPEMDIERGQKMEQIDFSVLREAIKNEVQNPEKEKVIVSFPAKEFYSRENGYRLPLPGSNREASGNRNYVPGDDLGAIDWKASAKKDGDLAVRIGAQEKEKSVNIMVDMGSLLDVERYQAGVKDLVNSIKALFLELRIGDKRGNYTLEQLIFVRPDGSSRAVKLKLSNRPSFNAVLNQINTVLEEEYKITQQLVENRSAEFNLGFYNEKENERYSWRVGGINDIQSQHKIKDLKWLFKGKGDTYLTGFKKEGIKIIGDLLQESSIMGIYWEGNKACAYHSSYSSSSLSMDSSQENTAKGGIDLTALPITTQSVLNQPLTANIPIASSALNLNINLDNELKQIQNMVNAGIIPSGERIREYALASSSLQKEEGYAQEIGRILGCIAEIFRLEEDRGVSTVLALKEMLILLESDKPARDVQFALSKITVMPKEPAKYSSQ